MVPVLAWQKSYESESSQPGFSINYGKGRVLGVDSWEDWLKWVFGLSLRGSLDCVSKSVDSSCLHAIVVPIKKMAEVSFTNTK